MTRNSASRETIDVLINNAKSTMSYSEQLLQNALNIILRIIYNFFLNY